MDFLFAYNYSLYQDCLSLAGNVFGKFFIGAVERGYAGKSALHSKLGNRFVCVLRQVFKLGKVLYPYVVNKVS